LVKDKDSYLNQGWWVEYYIQNGKNKHSCLPPDRSACFTNMVIGDSSYINDVFDPGDLSDELDVIWFELDEEDIQYITDLSEMRHLYLCGKYACLGDEAKYETIEQIRKLDGLKSVSVYTEWYDSFVEAGFDCKVYELIMSGREI